MTKFGFCCKWIDDSSSTFTTAEMNQKTTTQKYLRSQTKQVQFNKITELVTHNISALWNQLKWLSVQPESLRMFRITSEFLPLRTVKEFAWIYEHYSTEELIADGLRGVRLFADQYGIRLTMHPGQFTNLCSDRKEVVTASIEDFEYHARIAELMGYGDTWHSSGFAINIHANIRQDPGLKNIRRIIANDLSDAARNLITLENDEYSCNVDDFYNADVHQDVALVLDLHHHWIATKGQYIKLLDYAAIAFRESWRGIHPLGHMSMPDPKYIPAVEQQRLVGPSYSACVAVKGVNSSKLRAHSYDMWSEALMERAAGHGLRMDIEVEAKGKNIASRQLYEYAVGKGLI